MDKNEPKGTCQQGIAKAPAGGGCGLGQSDSGGEWCAVGGFSTFCVVKSPQDWVMDLTQSLKAGEE